MNEKHPPTARIQAYLLYGVDTGHEVESHLRSCRACADLASDLLLETPGPATAGDGQPPHPAG